VKKLMRDNLRIVASVTLRRVVELFFAVPAIVANWLAEPPALGLFIHKIPLANGGGKA
jgi:hypothetical protein